MGGYRDYTARASRSACWTRSAGRLPPPEEAAGREEDEPVEFEPDPELLKRIRANEH